MTILTCEPRLGYMLEKFFLFLLGLQMLHSLEEITNSFHKKFPLFKMKRSTFILFEIGFMLFWVIVYFSNPSTTRTYLMGIFSLLMFANGIWHMVWWALEKKYVPGLATAPLFVIIFSLFFFQILL